MPPPHQPISNTSDAARGSSLQSMKTAAKAKEEEERGKQRRKRGIILMMLQFMQEHGYARALDSLQQESNVSLQKFAPADNIDLVSIFSEFEDYYDVRFGRRPKFFRQVEADETPANSMNFAAGEGVLTKKGSNRNKSQSPTPAQQQQPPAPPAKSQHPPPAAPQGRSHTAQVMTTAERGRDAKLVPLKPVVGPPGLGGANGGAPNPGDGPLELGGRHIKLGAIPAGATPPTQSPIDEDVFQGRPLKPLPRFENQELQELAGNIHRDILDQNPVVSWDSIAELDDAKQLLKEAVVAPVKYPQLFEGIVRPWKGILLYGPPGTGKTMLAKAVATECRTTFFNISASSVVSKWRGDSEKLVRMLFDLAVHYAPSTIFIDELDSLMSQRTNDGSEHEGSRRMKTELLVQMDGLSKRKGGDVVFVLAASNAPWDLDNAMFRRMEKRILVGLPSTTGRSIMFRRLLKDAEEEFDFEEAARKTEGYSGADIDIVCREATMRTIRGLIAKLEANNGQPLDSGPVRRPRVSLDDVLRSVESTRSSCGMVDLKKYEVWAAKFGSTMS